MLKHGSVREEHCSTVFSWNPKEFDQLLKSCENDETVALTLKYLPNKNAKILEAGCGLGRVVKYLYDKGYHNVAGIEINDQAVETLNSLHPELAIIHGNILAMPYKKGSFDVVASYGVVEHFPKGPREPLQALYDILKPGGIGVITAPSFNVLRRVEYFLHYFDFRKYNIIRRLFGKKPFVHNKKVMGYYVDPQIGTFFEYRFTPKQFQAACKSVGFDIIESLPLGHIDGLFHSMLRPLVKHTNHQFQVSFLGKVLNACFSKIPFFHNHMHACIVRKPCR